MTKPDKPYGSGIFGTWITDEFGLPAYSYSLDQTEIDPGIAHLTAKDVDDRSKIKVSKTLQKRRNFHLIGNDRSIGLAVNNNTVQIFSGERGAKYLNRFAPELKGYSGGFGFIKDGDDKWSMLYSPKTDVNYKERIFGMGYFKKSAEKNDLEVTETVFTPFGKETTYLIEVKLKNNSNTEKTITYYHYWDILFNALGMGGNVHGNKGRWSGFFLNIKPFSDGKGLYAEHTYKRWWHPRPPREKESPVDFYPPIVFLKVMNEGRIFDSYETKKSRFFKGNNKVAEGLGLNWIDELSSRPLKRSRGGKQGGLMVLEKEVSLNPEEEFILKFAYGYQFLKDIEYNEELKQKKINETLKLYEGDFSSILKKSMESWKNYVISFTGDMDDFISREQAWHSYYLRAGANYNEYFDNYTIQQGGTYTYLNGANICLRDPLQHAFPMVYLYPELAREVLLYTLKCMSKSKEIPYGIVGNGFWTRFVFYPSDAELYTFLLATEYFLATRDFDLLNEIIPYYPARKNKTSTVKQRLIDCADNLINNIGLGTHHLIRMLQGDWNDLIIISDSWNRIFSTIQYGESCLNSAIASYALQQLSELFKVIDGNNSKFAEAVRIYREKIVKALRNEWNGEWFNRGYTGNGQIIGQRELYVSHHPWTIIGGVANEEQQQILVNNLYKTLSKPSDIGAICYWGPTELSYSKLEKKGTATNGGIWYSLNMPLIWGYSKVNRTYAWEEYKHIHLANRAEKYPGVWDTILSSCDSYNSYLGDGTKLTSTRAGKSTPSMDKFPVMVMHSCATPLYSTIKLSGIEVDRDGIIISPKIINHGNFHVKTELIEVGKNKDRIFGKYRNKYSSQGQIKIKIDLKEFYKIFVTDRITKNSITLEVNNEIVNDSFYDNGIISFDLIFKDKDEVFEWNIIISGGAD